MRSPQVYCRLLYLVGQLVRGGLERQLCYLLQTIHRERYKPAVVVWNHSVNDVYVSELRSLGIPVYCVSAGTSKHEKLRLLRRLIRTVKPEVIHSYSFYTNFAAWLCTLGTRTIPVGSIRNNFLSERRDAGRLLGRLSARWPRNQICNSLAAKRAVVQTVGAFRPTRLYVVRNRLNISKFGANSFLPSKPVLLAVGRLYRQKRWDRLIDIIALVKARGMRFSVWHAGEGPLLQDLKSQAKRLDVDRLIEFLGPRHDIPTLLADSLFLIHTADEEGCPNVVMEAMACGRAVVATDAGDTSYLIDDGKTGFVVRPGDDEAIADRIITLLTNRHLCNEMGENGRAKAEREFGLHFLVSETLDAYRAAGWRD